MNWPKLLYKHKEQVYMSDPYLETEGESVFSVLSK